MKNKIVLACHIFALIFVSPQHLVWAQNQIEGDFESVVSCQASQPDPDVNACTDRYDDCVSATERAWDECMRRNGGGVIDPRNPGRCGRLQILLATRCDLEYLLCLQLPIETWPHVPAIFPNGERHLPNPRVDTNACTDEYSSCVNQAMAVYDECVTRTNERPDIRNPGPCSRQFRQLTARCDAEYLYCLQIPYWWWKHIEPDLNSVTNMSAIADPSTSNPSGVVGE